MDGIQGIASKSTPPATTPAASDDFSAAGVFAALLDMVGARFTSDATLTMDAKLARGDDQAAAERAASDAARDARDAAKVRGDKDDERAAAKPKDAKKRDEDDSDDGETQAATNDDGTAEKPAADAQQQASQQNATPVVDTTALEAALAATETVAPVIIAQQVTNTTQTTQVQQVATEAVAAVAETAAVTESAKATVDAGAQVKEAVVIEAPAATQKAAAVAQNAVKQTAQQTTGPVQTAVTEETAAVQTTTTEVTKDTGKDGAKAETLAQRSAAAQTQSADLSQKVGPETKAQVQVTVAHNTGPQTATVASIYDIYAGYNGGASSLANGGVSTAEVVAQNTKTPADAAQAPVAAPPSPVLANQPVSQGPQQGPSSSSAMRADIAAPAATQSNTGNHASFGENSFGSAGSNTQTSNTQSASQTSAAERPMPPAQQVIDQIKVNITRAAKAGLDKVTIQLKPHELGRVDVQLEMSEDHKVRVTVTADNKDTLALLQNDSRSLERALNEAGLRTDSNNLHFSLRSDSDAQQAQDGRQGGRNNASNDNGATDEDEAVAMAWDYAAAAHARGGIDTFA